MSGTTVLRRNVLGERRESQGGLLPPKVLAAAWQTEASDEPVYIADAAGNLLHANAEFQRIATALADQGFVLAGDDISESIQALGRPLRQDHVLDIAGKRECFTSERMIVQDGAGRPLAIMGRFVAVDELRRLEDALAITDDRLRDVTRLVSDWIWETDQNLTLTYLSQRVFEKLGFHPRELIGRRIEDLATGAGEFFAEIRMPDGRAPFRGRTVVMQHRAGDRRKFHLSGVPMYCRRTGAFLGYRGTAEDITERDRHASQLLKAVDDAEAANRAKTEFLANMSHELRTPLNAIMGFSEIMSIEAMGPMSNPKYKEYAADIHESSRHLLDLISDLLDVAKIEAGKLELHEEPVSIAELVAATERFVAEAAERSGIELHADVAAGLPALSADSRRLRQILINLLSNAVKFTPSGGRIELSARRAADGGVLFSVRDTGIGIPRDKIAIAMAPFRQVDSGLARRYEGSGLGLPLAKVLAEMHGGSLELDSTPGVGTLVTIYLPPSRVIDPAASPR